jgi:hypothetical protein
MNNDNNTPNTPAPAGWWIAPLAVAGMVLAGAGHVLGAGSVTVVGAAMLLLAAGAGLASGWLVGLGPKPNAAAAAEAAAEVRRVTVMAPTGERELDVAISASGEVTAARWPGGAWGPAELVG